MGRDRRGCPDRSSAGGPKRERRAGAGRVAGFRPLEVATDELRIRHNWRHSSCTWLSRFSLLLRHGDKRRCQSDRSGSEWKIANAQCSMFNGNAAEQNGSEARLLRNW